MPASARHGHALPSFPRSGITRECQLQNRGQIAFRFHSGQQALADLLSATQPCLRTLHLTDPVADFLVEPVTEFVVPALERLVFSQDPLQFSRCGDKALLGVWLETKFRRRTWLDSAASLHALVDDHDVTALTGWEQ